MQRRFGMKESTSKYDLIIDSREKKPLNFRGAITRKLEFGDYGAEVDGQLLPVVFDRKSCNDFYSTLTSGHERFKKEMLRANDAGFKLIMIVESPYSDVLERKFEGAHNIKMRHGIIEKILHKMQVRYAGFEIVFCKDRKDMQKYIRNYFNALNEEYHNIYK